MADPLTVILMLVAGLLHASWHALIKSNARQISSLAGMGVVAGVACACALPFVAFPPAAVWVVIAASVVLHAGYKLALARAYSIADLSQAFPVARGLVPLFATIIAFWLLGEWPRPVQLAGVGIVSAGLLWLAFDAMRGGIDRRLFAAAAAAGLTVAGYTALDAYGTRLAGDWVSFTVWLVVADCSAFLVIARLVQGPELWAQIRVARVTAIMSGILGLASFTIFLWALSRAPVGVVAALRESSVLFAALIGMVVLRERGSPGRIVAAATIMVGLIVIAAIG